MDVFRYLISSIQAQRSAILSTLVLTNEDRLVDYGDLDILGFERIRDRKTGVLDLEVWKETSARQPTNYARSKKKSLLRSFWEATIPFFLASLVLFVLHVSGPKELTELFGKAPPVEPSDAAAWIASRVFCTFDAVAIRFRLRSLLYPSL